MSNARFSIVQSKAVRDKRITDPQFRTLSALGMYSNEDGWCYPKLSTLSEDIGKSKQAISKDITALCKLGYVEKTHQFRDDGSQKHNLYRLIFDMGKPTGNPPSTSEVDPPSTSEVDALTSHINDQIERIDDVKATIFTNLQSLGLFSTNLAQKVDAEIADWERHTASLPDSHPDKYITGLEAMTRATEAAVNANANSFRYIESCFDNWRKSGYTKIETKKKTDKQSIYADSLARLSQE